MDSARAAAHRARSERFNYRDQALSPVDHHEEETFDYLTKSDGAKGAIKHLKKAAELTHKAHAPKPVAGAASENVAAAAPGL